VLIGLAQLETEKVASSASSTSGVS
jgi:hypothetical protein